MNPVGTQGRTHTRRTARTGGPVEANRGIGSSLRRTAAAFALVALGLTGCATVNEPPAGTFSAPPAPSSATGGTAGNASASGSTSPATSPGTSTTGTTGTGQPPTPGTSTADPAAYQPATPTSPAKNVPLPKKPAQANDNTLEGQKAFIHYWLDTYNYMRETGDTTPFLAACEPTSKFCKGSVANLKKLQKDGIWRVGSPVQASDVREGTNHPAKNHAYLRLTITEPPTKYFDNRGPADTFKEITDKQEYESLADLKFSGEWKLVEMGKRT